MAARRLCYNEHMGHFPLSPSAAVDGSPHESDASRSIPLLLVGAPPKLDESWHTIIDSKPAFRFVGAVASCREAFEALRQLAPGECVVVVDFQLGLLEAVSLLITLRDQWPQLRCLALAATGEQRSAARAAGAEAVLLRGFHMDELSAVLEQFARSNRR